MNPSRISERTRKQLESLSPEKRAVAEAVIARTQDPDYRAKEAAAREALDREFKAIDPAISSVLRAARLAREVSLTELSRRSGIDPAALSRLESGKQINPTIGTLGRYAAALGLEIEFRLREPSQSS